MSNDLVLRTRQQLAGAAAGGHDWVALTTVFSEVMARAVPFSRTCWHSVDPGTVLFTGSVNHNIGCSGSWLAEHEYVIDDVNRWWFLARSTQHVGASSIATHGDLDRSPRHRSREGYGTGDELRIAFVRDGVYWGAAGFLREADEPWFTEADVRLMTALADIVTEAFRHAVLSAASTAAMADIGPGVVVFDEHGEAESISPTAAAWIAEMIEVPPPANPTQSKVVQAVATRARTLRDGEDPLGLAARSRVRTRCGRWLLLYGTRLSGPGPSRTAVVIQPAPTSEVAPLVALAYGLTGREREVTQLCMAGRSTKEIAKSLGMSPYTVQDHLKSIFLKTGARTRGELVGQIFLEHYVPRWHEQATVPAGWRALTDS